MRGHATTTTRAAALLAVVALVPCAAFGAGHEPVVHAPLPDFDARTSRLAPSAAQLATVAGLGAEVQWNRFGTPRTLIRRGGDLGSGYGAEAEAAARGWLTDHAGLFGLCAAGVAELETASVSRLSGTGSSVVLFRQRFGGLPAVAGGRITVGVDGGQIVYVTSSSAGEQAVPVPATLTATGAWLAAAHAAGRSLTLLDLVGVRQENGWTVFEVEGLSHSQRVRPVSFPTPDQGVLPAFEAVFVNAPGGSAEAYTLLIDAQTGALLGRRNRVYRAGGELVFARPDLSTESRGSFASRNMTSTDSLPAEASSSATTGGGVHDASSHAVTWSLGTAPVGVPSSATYTVGVGGAVPAGSAILNQAESTAELTVAAPAVATSAFVP